MVYVYPGAKIPTALDTRVNPRSLRVEIGDGRRYCAPVEAAEKPPGEVLEVPSTEVRGEPPKKWL
jgi:hypothetical protein